MTQKNRKPGLRLGYLGIAVVWLTAMINSTEKLPRDWLLAGMGIGFILGLTGIVLIMARASKK